MPNVALAWGTLPYTVSPTTLGATAGYVNPFPPNANPTIPTGATTLYAYYNVDSNTLAPTANGGLTYWVGCMSNTGTGAITYMLNTTTKPTSGAVTGNWSESYAIPSTCNDGAHIVVSNWNGGNALATSGALVLDAVLSTSGPISPTATPTPTSTSTPTTAPTATPTTAPTNTPTPIPATSTPTPTSIPPTSTPLPTSTPALPTATPVPGAAPGTCPTPGPAPSGGPDYGYQTALDSLGTCVNSAAQLQLAQAQATSIAQANATSAAARATLVAAQPTLAALESATRAAVDQGTVGVDLSAVQLLALVIAAPIGVLVIGRMRR
jgi:hypothetical protein